MRTWMFGGSANRDWTQHIRPMLFNSGSDGGMDDLWVAAVTTLHSTPDQLETLFRRLLASTAAPAQAPNPELPTMGQLLQHLLPEAQSRQSAPAVISTGPHATGLDFGIVFLLRQGGS